SSDSSYVVVLYYQLTYHLRSPSSDLLHETHSFPTRRSSDLRSHNVLVECFYFCSFAGFCINRVLRLYIAVFGHGGDYARAWKFIDRKSTRLNSSHVKSRMPSSA